MKLLAFVDLHGWYDILENIKKKAIKEKVDMLICAGDFTVFGREMDMILKKMDEINKKILIIPGNHENERELQKSIERYENLIYLHKASYESDEHIFFGYGGDGFSSRDKDFVKITKRFEKDLKKKDHSRFILILHGPPFGTTVDSVIDDHVGNQDYTDFIKRTQPDLVICGHLHENEKIEDKIGKSRIINPGAEGKVIEL